MVIAAEPDSVGEIGLLVAVPVPVETGEDSAPPGSFQYTVRWTDANNEDPPAV